MFRYINKKFILRELREVMKAANLGEGAKLLAVN